MALSELVVVTQFYHRFITMDSFFTVATSFYNARTEKGIKKKILSLALIKQLKLSAITYCKSLTKKTKIALMRNTRNGAR